MRSKEYWEQRAGAYRDTMATPYHRNRLRMVEALLAGARLDGAAVDFGCGDGIMSERILDLGGSVVAVDIDRSMVHATQERLSRFGGGWQVLQGTETALTPIATASQDLVLALNVLAYMGAEECERFYAETSRVLKPGGHLVVTHSNELFDMFTLNKKTVEFYKNHFSDFVDNSEVSALLTHPDKPDRASFPTRENPLAYGARLKRFSLFEERQEFAILHPRPPLLMPGFNPDDLAAREMEDTIGWAEDVRWKLMFMCSVFGARFVKG
jgi:SAM-dependent methyltransferase